MWMCSDCNVSSSERIISALWENGTVIELILHYPLTHCFSCVVTVLMSVSSTCGWWSGESDFE